MASTTIAGAGGLSISRPVVNPWLIAVSVMLATFMEVLDTSIASVALPYIAGSLSATNDEATWVLTSYLVANAIVLPASPWFSRKFGRKRFLISCIIIFTVSSFACGAATSLGMILLARAIQGAGGGALQPLSQAILLESFPPEKRGIAFARLRTRRRGGARPWADARRISHRHLLLALGVLHQHPHRNLCHPYDWRFVEDPEYIRNAVAGKIDAIGLGLLAIWLELPADRPRQGPGRRLVWCDVDSLGGRHYGRLPDPLYHSRADGREAAGGPERLSTPKFLDLGVFSSHCLAEPFMDSSLSCRCSTRSCWATRLMQPAGRLALAVSAR